MVSILQSIFGSPDKKVQEPVPDNVHPLRPVIVSPNKTLIGLEKRVRELDSDKKSVFFVPIKEQVIE